MGVGVTPGTSQEHGHHVSCIEDEESLAPARCHLCYLCRNRPNQHVLGPYGPAGDPLKPTGLSDQHILKDLGKISPGTLLKRRKKPSS